MSAKEFLRAVGQGFVGIFQQDPFADLYRAAMRALQRRQRTRRVRALARAFPNVCVDVRTGPDA